MFKRKRQRTMRLPLLFGVVLGIAACSDGGSNDSSQISDNTITVQANARGEAVPGLTMSLQAHSDSPDSGWTIVSADRSPG